MVIYWRSTARSIHSSFLELIKTTTLLNDNELEIAKELVNRGIDKNDIVLGFYPLYMRQFTEYAPG
ncbi:MAG: XisI protein [Cyanobacteria bacterium SID2]|nr:XisI protein [Cyanobacteria bacterium SID2]MBP0002794.1 XisI protein [Cyanobacteria bacterium SBC]